MNHTNSRYCIYTLIHKDLRADMFQNSMSLCRTDDGSAKAVFA